MLPGPKNVYEGNVYILDNSGANVVGVVGGLKFQRIPVTLLNRLLPPPAADKTVAPTTSQRRVATKEAVQNVAPTSETKQIPSKNIVPASLATQSNQIGEAKPLAQSASLASQVLGVISEALEVDLTELRDETYFGDIGLDSLMALDILSQLREILGFEVPGTLFIDHPSVKDLQAYLSQQSGTVSPQSEGDSDWSPLLSSVYSSQSYSSTATSLDICNDDMDIKAHGTTASSLISTIRNIIAEQMDILVAEITDSTDLPSLGLDSLMSLSILGSLREDTGLDWPSDLFITNPTIENIEQYIKRDAKSSGLDVHEPSPTAVNTDNVQTIDPANYPRAKAFLLQGHRARAKQTLFLFPDGSGSASSYAKIPPIAQDLVVYGFNCPFMTTPEQFTIGINGVAALYLAELRRLQPTGPYLLGGWSAGGVIAYEVMQQLLLSGERVERLVLLDAPCPLDIVRLPPRLHHFFGDIGLLGDLAGEPSSAVQKARIPEWLLPHFEACINALVTYKPRPIVDMAHPPKVHAIWARYGVCRFPHDPRPDFPIDDPPHLKWLLENRTDFGTNGWDKLIPGEIRTEVLDGNHFTIMNDDLVSLPYCLVSSFSSASLTC
jgi:acyl carrier protein/surfactin synthase thioesterase subunit